MVVSEGLLVQDGPSKEGKLLYVIGMHTSSRIHLNARTTRRNRFAAAVPCKRSRLSYKYWLRSRSDNAQKGSRQNHRHREIRATPPKPLSLDQHASPFFGTCNKLSKASASQQSSNRCCASLADVAHGTLFTSTRLQPQLYLNCAKLYHEKNNGYILA